MLERELHTRMELEKQLAAEKQEILKLKYEAKTMSLEQKLKESCCLPSKKVYLLEFLDPDWPLNAKCLSKNLW